MNEAELNRVDTLNEFIRDLEVNCYLHSLVMFDIEENISTDDEPGKVQRSVGYYLLSRYKDSVARLRKYVNSDNFTKGTGCNGG